jgi:Right handed beta helix region
LTLTSCIRAAAVGGVLWATLAATGHAREITVTAGRDKLQGAVASAAPGDVIKLANGTHEITGTVVINTPDIQIVGASRGTTIISKRNAAGADIAGIVSNVDSVLLTKFTIRGNGTGGPCILMYGNRQNSNDVTATGCGNNTVRSSGIMLHTSHEGFVGNVNSSGHRMVGLSQFDSSNNTIDGVTANNNGAEGLTVDVGSHNSRIYNSTFSGNNTADGGVGGVGIDASNGVIMNRNTVSGTKFRSGITLQNNVAGEDGLNITGNTIRNNAGHGMLVRNCGKPVTNSALGPNTYSSNGLNPAFKAECPL